MTSITGLQLSYSSFQLTGSANTATQAGGDFGALFAKHTCCCCDDSDAKKKVYHAGSGLNIDMSVFGVNDEDAQKSDLLLRLIDELFDKIRATLDKKSETAAQGNYTFSFTSEFQSVFGTDGPLFNFIEATTAQLGLSAEKNLALQNIAINNKDTDRSPESVAKIAGELKAAGIG